jgi:hypothetical protein
VLYERNMIDEWGTATGMVEDVEAGSSGARSLSANADGKHGDGLDRLDPSADLLSGPSAERRSVAQVLPIMIMSLLTLCFAFVGLAAAGFALRRLLLLAVGFVIIQSSGMCGPHLSERRGYAGVHVTNPGQASATSFGPFIVFVRDR